MPARPASSARLEGSSRLDRRSFVKGLSTLGLGWALGLTKVSVAGAFSPRRYSLVGGGDRGRIYREAILGRYRGVARLVDEVCASEDRLEDFQRCLAKKRSDTVIVAVSGPVACVYVVAALHAGCDVIMELAAVATGKAFTAILDASQRTGRAVRLALPHRYHSANAQVKNLLAGGTIGELLSVDFAGGCDHPAQRIRGDAAEGMSERQLQRFDLLNWWIGSAPLSLRSVERGAQDKADTPLVWISYGDGVTLSYSEKHCRSADGFKVAFNGTKGRLEHSRVIAADRPDGALAGHFSFSDARSQTRVLPLRGRPITWEAAAGDGLAVGEEQMLADLFSAESLHANDGFTSKERSAASALAILHGSRAAP